MHILLLTLSNTINLSRKIKPQLYSQSQFCYTINKIKSKNLGLDFREVLIQKSLNTNKKIKLFLVLFYNLKIDFTFRGFVV